MAKELPYWKFEPNQWENGNIQMFSREIKGLFIDLCSMYWSRLGDLPLKLAVQKLCDGNATALNQLSEEDIFSVVDGMICIDFLNEQFTEVGELSATNSKNAKSGWEKRRQNKVPSDDNATASNPQSESDAIRREEKRREEKNVLLKKEPKSGGLEIDWVKLLAKYNEIFEMGAKIIPKKAKTQLTARLKSGNFSKDDIITAMENAKRDKFHIDSNFEYCTIEYFSREDKLVKNLYKTNIKPVINKMPTLNLD